MAITEQEQIVEIRSWCIAMLHELLRDVRDMRQEELVEAAVILRQVKEELHGKPS